MSSYRSTLSYLYGLQYRGMKFGLQNIRSLLRAAGHPERRFLAIHVAGTNGKGSTSAFLAASFSAAGYRTGLYTSPHLVEFSERIRIEGERIDEERIVEYTRLLRPSIEKHNATFFEATTALAFLHFADDEVDVAIVETGLGGRLDATNVLTPMISVITNLALDHQEYLGDTLRSIAREKGGIIKPRVPVVTSAADPDALLVLGRIANGRHSPFHLAHRRVAITGEFWKPGGPVGFQGRNLAVGPVRLGMVGYHQHQNARLAVAVFDVLRDSPGFRREFSRISGSTIRSGLASVSRLTGLAGRLQWVEGRILLDVAHNPDGMQTMVRTAGPMLRRKVPVVVGVLKDKDAEGMIAALAPIASLIVAVRPGSPRALPARNLASLARKAGIPALTARSVTAGVRALPRRGKALVTGSHYVVGEALEVLTSKKP